MKQDHREQRGLIYRGMKPVIVTVSSSNSQTSLLRVPRPAHRHEMECRMTKIMIICLHFRLITEAQAIEIMTRTGSVLGL